MAGHQHQMNEKEEQEKLCILSDVSCQGIYAFTEVYLEFKKKSESVSKELASKPWLPTNISHWLITGMNMAEVIVSTRTRRKRTLRTIKTNFLPTFKDP